MKRLVWRSEIRSFLILIPIFAFISSDIRSVGEWKGIPVESPARSIDYEEIYAPVFVGRPPSDAYIGLSRLEDGEIRHYDYGEQSQLVVEEVREEMRSARKYIYSRDNGLTWFMKNVPEGFIGADIRSPVSGEYMRFLIEGDMIFAVRSEGGVDGEWIKRLVGRDRYHMFAPPVFIREGKRVLVTCHKLHPNRSTRVYFSDDDGLSWRFSEVEQVPDHIPGGIHLGPRWQNPGIEPTVVELKDGRIWMILRCSQDTHYQSFSSDGGESWSTPEPSRFYATLTMPRAGRLKDGRLLLIWNNTTPLPELSPEDPIKAGLPVTAKDGTWEDVFTNRSVIHAAISEDEGRTWRGFRELYLDPRRNAPDYAESGGVDHSVHQSQFVELDGGKVLVSFGQHPLHRALVVFDPDWLYETFRKSDFSRRLEDWSIHKFIGKIRGHCSFNRKQGAQLVKHPEEPDRRVLHIKRPHDPSLLIENDGAVWNFPAGKKGVFATRIMFPRGSQGVRINLTDRWFNPVDVIAYQASMFSVKLSPGKLLEGWFSPQEDTWYTLRFEWDGLSDLESDSCRLFVNDLGPPIQVSLNKTSINGISYVHFISSASGEDESGVLVEYVEANIE